VGQDNDAVDGWIQECSAKLMVDDTGCLRGNGGVAVEEEGEEVDWDAVGGCWDGCKGAAEELGKRWQGVL
jgi:hypothetical protein